MIYSLLLCWQTELLVRTGAIQQKPFFSARPPYKAPWSENQNLDNCKYRKERYILHSWLLESNIQLCFFQQGFRATNASNKLNIERFRVASFQKYFRLEICFLLAKSYSSPRCVPILHFRTQTCFKWSWFKFLAVPFFELIRRSLYLAKNGFSWHEAPTEHYSQKVKQKPVLASSILTLDNCG